MKPYYQDEWVTIYHGDCREILPELELETIITDPTWPDADVKIAGYENPYQLFAQMCEVIPLGTERLVVQLGCDSDPRFLNGIPSSWPFLRVCWLEYVRPHYKGRLLYTSDIAYAFGYPPAAQDGRFLMPGRCLTTRPDKEFLRHTKDNHKRKEAASEMAHPTPRRLEHLDWLVKWFSDKGVCDPFMGSGTTGVAAKKLGRRFIGIEIKEEYLELAIKRIRRQPLAVQDNMLLET